MVVVVEIVVLEEGGESKLNVSPGMVPATNWTTFRGVVGVEVTPVEGGTFFVVVPDAVAIDVMGGSDGWGGGGNTTPNCCRCKSIFRAM